MLASIKRFFIVFSLSIYVIVIAILPHNSTFSTYFLQMLQYSCLTLRGYLSSFEKCLILICVPISASISQPVHIQRIPPKHTTHGVGDDGNDLIPAGADVVAALHALGHVILGAVHPIYRDVLVRHLGGSSSQRP